MNKVNKRYVVLFLAPYNRAFSNLKKGCKKLKLPYHSLKDKKFPIEYKGLSIDKWEIE